MIYTPSKGFFDISNRPETLNKRTHEKFQKIQMELASIQSNYEYYRKFYPQQLEQAKEMSAQLQQIIFQHWSHEELFGVVEIQCDPVQMVIGF